MGKSKVRCLLKKRGKYSFCGIMQEQISGLEMQNRMRTSEAYASALNSFMRFRRGKDVRVSRITPELVESYESYLKEQKVCMNTSSFYMRILRAVYNRAAERGLTVQRYPFKKVYTGVGKTVKRAVLLKTLRKIKQLELTKSQEYARDMFLFSFYTRGMSFVDMAYLKKTDLREGFLFYCRRKTGQRLKIRWEACMARIVNKYVYVDSPYLLPIICRPGEDERKQYKSALCRVNRNLKVLGRALGLSEPLTMYVARHSWASIARSRSIPVSVISEGLGHDSEATTRIYLASLDSRLIDVANRKVLNLL